jgi:hypothetical protein
MANPQTRFPAIRRRSIGAVLMDICRDLGITSQHPL